MHPAGQTVDHQALLKQFEHLNHGNPGTFEVEDLDRLMKSVQTVMDSSPLFTSAAEFPRTETHKTRNSCFVKLCHCVTRVMSDGNCCPLRGHRLNEAFTLCPQTGLFVWGTLGSADCCQLCVGDPGVSSVMLLHMWSAHSVS